ncbi:MAG TPA: SDR family NAD(P)-dependent oxidoreductase, partial [Tepidisphaeraceae bacterium]|nr:SDR family NAD(P)-dependent oxidoreductase [Tepidisphaeraceae bacterium]
MTPRPLEDKVIVIIGGTTGLGLSAAQACVKAGGKVVVVGRDRDNAKAAARGLGENSKSLSGDASDPDTAPKA